jgi:hypothetical protein
MRRFNDIMEAAKEMNIEVLNPCAQVLEAAFESYITENHIIARSLVADEGLLRKSFYDDMSPMERASTSNTAACELRSPETTSQASPAKNEAL